MALIKNKKATLNFEILERIEAGLALRGFEVKAIRAKNGSLAGSFIKIRHDQAWLTGAYIAPFQAGNTPADYDPYRDRQLLLNRRELKYLAGKQQEKGLTIIPISMYNKGSLIKLELAVVRGKKKHDKRQDIKKRDTARDIKREFKTRLR